MKKWLASVLFIVCAPALAGCANDGSGHASGALPNILSGNTSPPSLSGQNVLNALGNAINTALIPVSAFVVCAGPYDCGEQFVVCEIADALVTTPYDRYAVSYRFRYYRVPPAARQYRFRVPYPFYGYGYYDNRSQYPEQLPVSQFPGLVCDPFKGLTAGPTAFSGPR